jgi:outer membrane protein TolC
MIRTVFITLAFFPLMGFAQEAPVPDTLRIEEAVDVALEKNYSIRIAQREKQISINDYKIGYAAFLPTIALDGLRTYSVNDTRQVSFNNEVREVEDAKSNRLFGSVIFNWTIFDGTRMFIAYDQLREFKALGEENAKVNIENTVALVSNAYYDIIQQQEKASALLDALKISEQRLSLAQAQYEVGAGSKLNYLGAQVDYNTDKAALILQQQLLQNAKISLNELLGRDAGTDFIVSDTILVDQSMNLASLKESTIQRNSNLLLAQRNRNLTYLEAKALRAERFPRLSLTGDYTYSRNEAQVGFALSNRAAGYTYGARVTMNILNGMDQTRRIQNARVQQEIANYRLDELKVQLEADLQRVFNDYKNSLDLIELEQQNLEVARQNIDIALERYKLGVATPLELREVQRNAVATESRLIEAEYRAKVAEIELLRLSSRILQ